MHGTRTTIHLVLAVAAALACGLGCTDDVPPRSPAEAELAALCTPSAAARVAPALPTPTTVEPIASYWLVVAVRRTFRKLPPSSLR